MPKNLSEKKSKGELTRERILEATAICIANYGIEASSITQISQEADVSRALVAHYFPQKSEIFLQVIHFIVEKAYLEINQKTPATSEDQLIYIFKSNLDFFLEKGHYFKCFMLFYYLAGVEKRYRALNTKLSRVAVERIFASLKACGRDELELAETLHLELMGAILKFHSTNVSTNRKAYTEDFLNKIRIQLQS